MKIGILQVDGDKPNLALMKIAAYHEQRGDQVSQYIGPLFDHTYDKIYASKIFSFSPMPELPAGKSVIGGTGIDFSNRLPQEIEAMTPSYSLYPDFKAHIGFSMKGCRLSCSFCVVPTKEGKPFKYNTIDEILINPKGRNRLMLLDNDFFGTGDWERNLRRIIELNLKVNFSQGLNIRILTQRQATLLAQCRYYASDFKNKLLTFAWDRYEDKDDIMKGIERCDNAGIPRDHLQFFVLIGYDTTPAQDEDRILTLRRLGCMPFVMKYDRSNAYQKALARVVNRRAIWRSPTFESSLLKITRE